MRTVRTCFRVAGSRLVSPEKAVPRKHPPCPDCGSPDVAWILYGLILPDAKLNEDLEQGKVFFGGCCIREDDPDWHCNACGREFRSSNRAAAERTSPSPGNRDSSSR